MPAKLIWTRINNAKVFGLAIIFSSFFIGVFRESFWSDDYPALIGTRAMATHLLADARPTSAGLLSASFSLLNSPSHAWILRTLALLGLALIFLFVSKKLENTKDRDFGVIAIAIAFCLPSFQMYIHWVTAWYYPWAGLAGLYSFQLWSTNSLVRRISAVLVLGLALTTYPPAALFFFATFSVIGAVNGSASAGVLKDARRGATLFIFASVLAGLVATFSLKVAGVSSSDRVRLVNFSEIPTKIVWILSRPIVVGLRPFTVDSPNPKFALMTAFPMLLLLVVGVARQSRRLRENALHRALSQMVPLLLSLAPIAVASDNQIEFRIIPGYCWGAALGAFYLFIESQTLLHKLRASRIPKLELKWFAPAILSFVAIGTVNLHFNQLFGSPYQVKTAFLNSEISGCLEKGGTDSIVIYPPKTPFPVYQRLGVFSISTDLASTWVPQPNVELLLRQRKAVLAVSYLDKRPTDLAPHPGECILDLEEFRASIK